MSIASLLQSLTADPEVPRTRLAGLSNISLAETAELDEHWPRITDQRRRYLIGWLRDLIEDNVQLNFDAVFLRALGDSDPVVRSSAVDALWENDDFRLVERFVDLLESDPDPGVRAAAANALSRFALAAELDDTKGMKAGRLDRALLETFNRETEDVVVRRRSLEAISTRSIPGIPEAIQKAYRSRSPDLRIGAIYAMGRSCDPRWLPELLDELGNDEAEMRYEAVVALGEIESESAVTSIVPLVDDEDSDVRLAAVGALGKIGGTRARGILKDIARSDDPVMSEAAESALNETELDNNPLRFGL